MRWMENRKEATDAGDVGVAQAVAGDQQWQMHDQQRLHPRWRQILAHTHTQHAHKHTRSGLIEAGGSAPRKAQGGSDCHPFLSPPPSVSPLPYNTPTHTIPPAHGCTGTSECAIFSPTHWLAGWLGFSRVPPESNKSRLKLKQLVRPHPPRHLLDYRQSTCHL